MDADNTLLRPSFGTRVLRSLLTAIVLLLPAKSPGLVFYLLFFFRRDAEYTQVFVLLQAGSFCDTANLSGTLLRLSPFCVALLSGCDT